MPTQNIPTEQNMVSKARPKTPERKLPVKSSVVPKQNRTKPVIKKEDDEIGFDYDNAPVVHPTPNFEFSSPVIEGNLRPPISEHSNKSPLE